MGKKVLVIKTTNTQAIRKPKKINWVYPRNK